MGDQVSVRLPCEPVSARRAREFVAEQCRSWHLDGVCADLVLPVSELVTNAVLHARTPITVTVVRTPAYIQVSVRDNNPRPPVLRPVRLDLDSDIAVAAGRSDVLPEDPRDIDLWVGPAGSISAGRGLHIVDAVADEWGVSELSPGKNVWFRVRTDQASPDDDARRGGDAAGDV